MTVGVSGTNFRFETLDHLQPRDHAPGDFRRMGGFEVGQPGDDLHRTVARRRNDRRVFFGMERIVFG